MLIVFCLRAKHYRLSWKATVLFCLCMYYLGGYANRGMYLLAYLPDSLDAISPTVGGDSWGNFFLFVGVSYLVAKLTKNSFGRIADCFAPGMLAMFIFAQIGCYLNGCCIGITMGNFVFPVQMLEACFGFGLLMYVLYKDQQRGMGGKLYPTVLVAHGMYRFFSDFLRASARDLIFSRGQWLALISVLVGLLWLFRISRIKSKECLR